MAISLTSRGESQSASGIRGATPSPAHVRPERMRAAMPTRIWKDAGADMATTAGKTDAPDPSFIVEMVGTQTGRDLLCSNQHGARMARIRSKNTEPERLVRSMLHRLGYRYRLHRRDLPGTPDLAFPSRRKVILVHGCFWHGHAGCKRATTPVTRPEFWRAKFAANRARDARTEAALAALGWSVMTVWECEVGRTEELAQHTMSFLGRPRAQGPGSTSPSALVARGDMEAEQPAAACVEDRSAS